MRKRRTMVFGVVTALLLVSVAGVGCGSKGNSDFVVNSDLVDLCSGEGVSGTAPYTQTSGLHPIVYAQKALDGWDVPSKRYTTPSDWEVEDYNLAGAELVACIEEEETTIEECSYTVESGKSATLQRVQVQVVVTLREAQTGEVVATSGVIKGETPSKCGTTEEFTAGKDTKTRTGKRPSEDIKAWLKQYVEIP